MSIRGSLLALVALLIASPALAQGLADRRQALSFNPLGIPFGYFAGEYEARATDAFTIGGSLSYYDISDDQYFSAEVKARLYPAERALQGLSVGLAGGITRLDGTCSGASVTDCSETGPSISVIVDYNWLLGRTNRFFLGTGVGAKRIFGIGNDYDDLNEAYPTVRFQMGVAF
jgi:hypothetical protein